MESRWDHEFAAVATRLPGCRAPRNQFQVVVHEPTRSAVAYAATQGLIGRPLSPAG
jgi:hypothetical protein